MSRPPPSPSKYSARPQTSYSGSSSGEPSSSRPSFAQLDHAGPDSPRDSGGLRVARKAFFCDVVLENGPRGDGTTTLLSTLGDRMTKIPYPPESSASSSSTSTPGRMSRSESVDGLTAAQISNPNPKKLQPLLEELLSTERTYVRRLRALKLAYADPLRLFSRDPSMAIIPAYNATALFGNIDAIVLVNEAFLEDLERAIAGIDTMRGGRPEGVGDVVIRHFREVKAFDCYRTYYDKCEDAQAMFADMIQKRRSFADFVQASKYKTEGVNNVGLRELLMEPVQRIPRYTMIWQLMVKSMAMTDPQRSKLVEATEIASAIATCEKDDNTKRMIVMSGLARVMDGFPAELINNNRDFYDSLDAEDLPPELVGSPQSSHASSSHAGGISASTSNPSVAGGMVNPANGSTASSLHCSLFLFSDRLLIAKRPSAHQSGRKLTGLDDVSKLWKGSIIGGGGAGGGVGVRGGPGRSGGSGDAKDGGGKLSCKGVVNVLDVVASDLGGGDFHLHLLRPPMSPSPRWSARPSRRYTVVHPPQPISLDPQAARADKHRFVHNLWAAQALVRARGGKSQVLVAAEDEKLMDAWGKGRARGFWNVWEREDWHGEGGKAKIVVQVDESGGAKKLAFGDGCAPHAVVKVQPLAGNMCRVSIHTRDSDEAEDIIHTTSVPSKILQTIHRLGLYQPRSDAKSCPTTPTSAHTRRPMLGLDAISRNLFGSGSTSSRGEGGGFGSMSHKRTRSATSKASTIDSSITRSTISSLGRASDNEGSHSDCNNTSRSRGKSPTSPGSKDGRTSPFSKRKPVPREEDIVDESEWDLRDRLELARKNSQSAAGRDFISEDEDADQGVLGAVITTMTTTTSAIPTAPVVISPKSAGFLPTSPLRVRNKTPVLEKAAFLDSPADVTPQPEVRPFSPSTSAPRGPSPSPFSRALSPVESKRPLGPRAPTPSVSAVISPEGRRAPQASLGHGLGSSHTKIRLMSTESGHRRVSDEWRRARPSLAVGTSPTTNVTSPALPPLPVMDDAPDSPCSTSSIKRRERAKSMEVPSPTLGKKPKRDKDDGGVPSPAPMPRSPLLPRNADLVGNGSPVGRPPTVPRKVSLGGSGTPVKRGIQESELAIMGPEERAAALAGLAKEDATTSRRTVKRMRLEVEGLRSHFSKDLAQKDRLARMGETPGGGLPRSPPSRHISQRASNRVGSRVEEARMALENSASEHASGRHSSSRKGGVDVAFLDDWCGILEGLVEELDRDLKRVIANSETLKGDVASLVEGTKNSAQILTLQSQLDNARTHLEQAQRDVEDQKKELLDAKNENAALYEAFNEELEQMYADMTLPGAEAHVAMKRDIQVTKADRNALRLENATLKRELEQAIYEKERHERKMREHGLL